MRMMSVFAIVGALASVAASPTRPPPGGDLPQGSYLQSCRGASVRGSILSAQCPQRSGAPVFSTIDVNACRGRDIANDNGRLVCLGGGGPRPPTPPGPPDRLPQGSYLKSCQGAVLDGYILAARCPGPRGAPFSRIDIRTCHGRDIANESGQLGCRGGGGVGPGPGHGGPGGPGARYGLRAYSGTQYSGARLDVRTSFSNLASTGFNDRIRSIRVDGGRWEVCVDSKYRGRCVTITRSVSNLNDIGMSRSISSIRPK